MAPLLSVLVFVDLSPVFESVLKYKNGKQNPEVCETLEVRSPLLFGGQDSCSMFCFKETVYWRPLWDIESTKKQQNEDSRTIDDHFKRNGTTGTSDGM